jgi:hypothetical protein
MHKIIRFTTHRHSQDSVPVLAKRFIPDWYKKSSNTTSSGQKDLKTCVPFLDTMTSGYFLVTPYDIYISWHGKDDIYIYTKKQSSTGEEFIQEHEDFIGIRESDSGELIPRPEGHEFVHLVWKNPWAWKTPRGWSTLVTHPLNRFDLPFTTLAGIVDSDKYHTGGNIPFFIKKGFEGLIPKGTPYAHILPMKRSDWTMLEDEALIHKTIKMGNDVRSEDVGVYKKKYWQRKSY